MCVCVPCLASCSFKMAAAAAAESGIGWGCVPCLAMCSFKIAVAAVAESGIGGRGCVCLALPRAALRRWRAVLAGVCALP